MKKIIPFFAICVLAGCTQLKPKTKPAKIYRVGELIDVLEKNTSGTTRLRCKGGNITVKLPEENGGRMIDLDGVVVLYEYPNRFYLSGSLLGKPRLIIGSNKVRYWIGVMYDPSELRWGKWSESDKMRGEIQFDPQCFLEAFGNINFRDPKYTGPFLDRRESENVLMYGQVDNGGEWYFAKEVHVSRYEPVVVTEIVYFDMTGKRKMVIKMSDYRQIDDGSYVAGRIELYWPAKKSFMKVDLGKVRSVKSLPQQAFEFPDKEGFDKVYLLD